MFRIWDDFKTFESKFKPEILQTLNNRFWSKVPNLVAPQGNIYLNTKSRFLKLGLIFGYSNDLKPVLKINEEFHRVEHELNANDEIIAVEGWACGSTKAVADQETMKKWENKQIEKMRTVNREMAWGEEKAILDMAGIKIEHSERGDI